MAKTTGIELLSALRKAGSYSLLREVPESYFLEQDEREAFIWLKNYVSEYRKFPQPTTFFRSTRIELCKTREPLPYYVNRARERALFYGISGLLAELQECVKDKRPDDAVNICREVILLKNSLSTRGGSVVNLEDALQEVMTDHEVGRWNPGMRGIPTGWEPCDRATGGWQNGDLITLVGRTGVGKTWQLLHTAHTAWQAGRSVLFLSMEMTVLQSARRWLGINSSYNPNLFKYGMSTSIEREVSGKIHQAVQGGVPFNFIAGNFKKTVDVVRATAEELLPDLICVDASYLLTPEKKRSGNTGRREVISDVIEELGSLTKDLNRPCVNTVQFNRQAVRTMDRRGGNDVSNSPLAHLGLHKIAESDAIGQTSSIVMATELGLPPHEFNTRYLGFLKGREGEMGHWLTNYKFKPYVDFSVIPETRNDDNTDVTNNSEGNAPINLDFEG